MTTSSSDQNAMTAHPKRKRPSVLVGVVLLLALAVAGFFIYLQFFAGVNPGPTFLQELRAGTVSESDIRSVEILKFDPGAGWPFAEKDYSRKARKRITAANSTGELITILRDSSTDGHQHRNHPSSFYDGILRIELIQGGHYYVFYSLSYYDGKYYASLRANSKDSTNPNGAAKYENVPLADFLKRNDPWYRDADSPTTDHRPGYPDDVP